jgi:hypothetical protein
MQEVRETISNRDPATYSHRYSSVFTSAATTIPGLGFVFVEYETVDQAMNARKALNGLKFAEQVVEAVFYPEDSFKKKLFDL